MSSVVVVLVIVGIVAYFWLRNAIASLIVRAVSRPIEDQLDARRTGRTRSTFHTDLAPPACLRVIANDLPTVLAGDVQDTGAGRFVLTASGQRFEVRAAPQGSGTKVTLSPERGPLDSPTGNLVGAAVLKALRASDPASRIG